ncbi:MAG: hypothetical protein IKZ49_01085 [Alphaproteobacteria bacterium]|nr:hypothetical protein [Alphaproteobacteria bacterium]
MNVSIKVYTKDQYWNHILTDLGVDVVSEPSTADVVFDDIDIQTPISAVNLQNILINAANNADVIKSIFGKDVFLPSLQHKIVVLIYKNPCINIKDLKSALGIAPDISTHSVENAIYQLRKNYGRDFILNADGGYKIGSI